MTENGRFRGAVPSGASTGTNEAKELRDGGARHGPFTGAWLGLCLWYIAHMIDVLSKSEL